MISCDLDGLEDMGWGGLGFDMLGTDGMGAFCRGYGGREMIDDGSFRDTDRSRASYRRLTNYMYGSNAVCQTRDAKTIERQCSYRCVAVLSVRITIGSQPFSNDLLRGCPKGGYPDQTNCNLSVRESVTGHTEQYAKPGGQQ